MKVRIQDIPPEGRTVSEDLDASWTTEMLEGAGRGGSPVELSVRVERVAEKVLLRGECRATVDMDCVRCLDNVSETYEFPFTHVLEPRPEDFEEEVELEAEQLDTSYIDGPEFELDDVVREQLLLSLPMNTLCREDCAGLCASCGKNKNHETCSCSEVNIDPRWAALQNVRLKDS